MTIKIEIPSHDRAALRVFAAALASLEAEREAEEAKVPRLADYLADARERDLLNRIVNARAAHNEAPSRCHAGGNDGADIYEARDAGKAPDKAIDAGCELLGLPLPRTPVEAPPPPPESPVTTGRASVNFTGETNLADAPTGLQVTATVSEAPPPPLAELDVNGVPCDRNYCGPSKKADGTWPRKRGVDETVFNTWYASQRSAAPAPAPAPVAPPPPQSAPTPPPASDPSSGVGPFMAWVSGLQAAGRLTQEQVKASFTEERILQPMLFNKALDTCEMLRRLVANITAKAGA